MDAVRNDIFAHLGDVLIFTLVSRCILCHDLSVGDIVLTNDFLAVFINEKRAYVWDRAIVFSPFYSAPSFIGLPSSQSFLRLCGPFTLEMFP